MKSVRFINSVCSSRAGIIRWSRLLMLCFVSTLLGACFPPNESGRPWYGERYVNTPQYQRDKAKHAQQQREGAERSERRAVARKEYEAQEAERSKQYQTRSWCEFRNAQRRREALARGSQSYKAEDCSRYPR